MTIRLERRHQRRGLPGLGGDQAAPADYDDWSTVTATFAEALPLFVAVTRICLSRQGWEQNLRGWSALSTGAAAALASKSTERGHNLGGARAGRALERGARPPVKHRCSR